MRDFLGAFFWSALGFYLFGPWGFLIFLGVYLFVTQ